MPCGGPHPRDSGGLNYLCDPIRSFGVADSHKDLVEDNVVDDLYAVDGVESSRESAGQRAASVDEVLQTDPAERPQRCPRSEPASTT